MTWKKAKGLNEDQYAFWGFCLPQILAKIFLEEISSPFELAKFGQISPEYLSIKLAKTAQIANVEFL